VRQSQNRVIVIHSFWERSAEKRSVRGANLSKLRLRGGSRKFRARSTKGRIFEIFFLGGAGSGLSRVHTSPASSEDEMLAF
jgi:hypothetical protein